MNRVEAALRRIASDLDLRQAEWALIGGFAVSARAEPRFTRDVDVAVLVAGTRPQDAADLLALASVLGPEDRSTARTAVELIVKRGFGRGRTLSALLDARRCRGCMTGSYAVPRR